MPQSDPENEPRYLALLQLLRTAEEIWRASRVFFERWGLGPSQFNVLNLLRLYPEGLSQTDLSKFLVMHRSNITGLVDHLERRGLAERKDAAADRRAYRVVLTPAGAKLLAEILPGYYEGARRIWGDLSNRRVSQAAATLASVAGNVEDVAVEVRARLDHPPRAKPRRGSAGRSGGRRNEIRG